MSFKKEAASYVISNAIMLLVKDAKKKGLVQEAAKFIKEQSTKNLGRRSDQTETEIVSSIILPLGREVLCDTTEGAIAWRAMLAQEYTKVSNSLKDLRGV